MKSTNNWQDALAGLRDTLPQGEETVAEEQVSAAKLPRLDIILEKKGRGGKQATIISGFELTNEELLDVAAKLKQKLGAGGSARGGEILIQGDRRADVQRQLSALGYKSRII